MVIAKESTAIVNNFKTAVGQFWTAYTELSKQWDKLQNYEGSRHDTLVKVETDKIVCDLTNTEEHPFFVASFDELGVAKWCEDVYAALKIHEVNFERALILLGDVALARQLLEVKAERKEDGSVDGLTEDMVDFFREVFPRADARLNNCDLVDGKPPKDWTKSDEEALETLFAMAETALGNRKGQAVKIFSKSAGRRKGSSYNISAREARPIRR